MGLLHDLRITLTWSDLFSPWKLVKPADLHGFSHEESWFKHILLMKSGFGFVWKWGIPRYYKIGRWEFRVPNFQTIPLGYAWLIPQNDSVIPVSFWWFWRWKSVRICAVFFRESRNIQKRFFFNHTHPTSAPSREWGNYPIIAMVLWSSHPPHSLHQ